MRKKMKLWQKIVLALVALGIIGALAGGNEEKTEPTAESVEADSLPPGVISLDEFRSEKETASVEEPKEEKYLAKYFYDDQDSIIIYITALKMVGAEYVNVKYPWGFDEYTFVDLSEEDDGKVVGRVKVTADGVVEKMDVICCFWTDGLDVKWYYFSCGDKVYYTDGTLEEVFS